MRTLISQDPIVASLPPVVHTRVDILDLLSDCMCRGVKCKRELGTGINLTKSGIHLIFIFVMPIIYASCIAMVTEHCFVNKL